ncbi:MAG: hypothetical protein ACHP7H_02545 [Hyphomicrobiales bacterium]
MVPGPWRPGTLDGLTPGELKRLFGSLIDRELAPNTIHDIPAEPVTFRTVAVELRLWANGHRHSATSPAGSHCDATAF